ncbi:MAG: MFS transporter [Alphaproteobacteria bacterium]|nr:MFS transporter [Alphaproteobacteria bacterium]
MTEAIGARDEARGDTTLTGDQPAALAARIAWTFYEFGGGPYFVALVVFVFAAYFANHVVLGDPVTGQAYWGYIGGLTGFLVALLSPMVGAIADRYGPRKPGLALFTAIAVPCICALYFAKPGAVLWAATFVVLSSLTLELAFIFHNAMLPAIAPARRIGTLSAVAYAMSYAGALLGLFLYLSFEVGGADDAAHVQERSIALLSAVFVALFVFPLLILTPDARRSGLSLATCVRQGIGGLARTLRAVRDYRHIVTFLLARMLYYDGLTAVFAFVAIFAASVFGWEQEKVSLYALISIIALPVSAVIGGLVDDRVGSKLTIQVSLVAFMTAMLVNIGTDPDTLWYFIDLTPDEIAMQLPLLGAPLAAAGFTTLPEQAFLTVGFVGALFVGPALASSRTYMARMAPPAQVAEFFGLYNLSGRATAFLAPLTVGFVTQVTGDQRLGLSVVFVFVTLGFVLLWFVRPPVNPSGGSAASRSGPASHRRA